jgi:hypothetical protein
VGDIAARYLNPKAQTQVAELLKSDQLADGQPSGRRTLGEVASWADEIKDFDWGRRRGSWHYDDIPLCDSPEYAKYCRGGRCASAQLAHQIEVLGDSRARPRARNEALKWVVHLIGDIHQPLHAATHADRGGNVVQVSFRWMRWCLRTMHGSLLRCDGRPAGDLFSTLPPHRNCLFRYAPS